MGRIKRGLCAVPLAMAALPAAARLHGEVTAFGEVTGEPVAPAVRTPGSDTLEPTQPLDDLRFVSRTDRLEAQLCLRFGVSVRVSADPGEAVPRPLVALISHPAITRPDGASNTQDSFPTPLLDAEAYAGWTFNHRWEMQPGTWTIAFLSAGEVLAAKSFTVTVPDQPGSLCQAEPVS